MQNLSQAFQSYNETMRLGFEQLNRDLRALNDAADNVIMRLAADDGAIVPAYGDHDCRLDLKGYCDCKPE